MTKPQARELHPDLGAEITGLVPPLVFERLREKQGRGPLTEDSRGPRPEEAL